METAERNKLGEGLVMMQCLVRLERGREKETEMAENTKDKVKIIYIDRQR